MSPSGKGINYRYVTGAVWTESKGRQGVNNSTFSVGKELIMQHSGRERVKVNDGLSHLAE